MGYKGRAIGTYTLPRRPNSLAQGLLTLEEIVEMTDCKDYDDEKCGGCVELGGTDEVGCYKPFEAKKANGSKVPCSGGLCAAWISLDNKIPDDNQSCKVLFDDGSETTGNYWADLGIFVLTGPLTSLAPQNVTPGMPSTDWVG